MCMACIEQGRKRHMVTHIAMIKDVFSRTDVRMSYHVSSCVSFSESILPYARILS